MLSCQHIAGDNRTLLFGSTGHHKPLKNRLNLRLKENKRRIQ